MEDAAPAPPAFSGEVVELYNLMFEQNVPSWEAIAAAVSRNTTPGQPLQILDLAAGPGEPTCHMAARLKNATFLCTDVSDEMVSNAVKRASARGLSNVTCEVVDAQNLSTIASGSQDVVTVCYGLMFMPDLQKALAEMKRVLKPDSGILVATVWAEMPMIKIVGQTMTEVLGSAPPPPPINPLSLSDPALLDAALSLLRLPTAGVNAVKRASARGLSNVTCEVVDAQNLSTIASGSQDVVTVCYGLMFMPDLQKALAEMKRVLKPDSGILVATVWAEMPMIKIVGQTMTEVLGSAPPPPPINPLSLSDPALLDAALGDAGFSLIESAHGSYSFALPKDPDLAWKAGLLPVLNQIEELHASGKHGDVKAKAKMNFQNITATMHDDSGVIVYPPGTYRLVIAKP
eukprot:CAMPEP_0114272074 /NCGR_PEP_ID=MMETSP0058-20121206/28224_1 /TAXON_ID=36894 /ORGANISM="Pyramimonas parkeae, CCMP726" /LENGTH=401 /DNA_ID=CAMNT_0001391147 /DNA_START=3493 /DNA_END=4699 /DNA_ORIENTATION=-